MLGSILPVQLLQQCMICLSSVFHIRRTRQTSPQVIFTSLRRWEASLSGPTKRCRRRCTSGCTVRQKTFFYRYLCTSEALQHLYGTQWKLRKKRCHFVSYVFNKLREKKYLKFSFDSPSYLFYNPLLVSPIILFIFSLPFYLYLLQILQCLPIHFLLVRF